MVRTWDISSVLAYGRETKKREPDSRPRERRSLRLNIGTMQFVYDGGAVGHITDAYALAQDWELAE